MSPYELERLCDSLPGVPAKPTRVYTLEEDPANHPVAPGRGYRLSDTQVRAMRQDHRGGCKYEVLAEVYGLSREYVRAICARREYRHVA